MLIDIPEAIWNDNRLNITDIFIFTRISDNAKKHNSICSLSNTELSEFCRCSFSKVTKSISKLVFLRYIEIVGNNGRQRFIKLSNKIIPNHTLQKLNNKGYVYVFKCNEYYKIGVSKNVEKRLQQLNTQRPYEVCLIYKSSLIEDPYKVKKQLHKMFEDKRISQEWFELNISDIDDISDYVKTHIEEFST